MNNLVIGLGGTGGKTLRALRKLIFAEQRLAPRPEHNINYLYIDSSSEMMAPDDRSWRVLGTSVQLPAASQLLIVGEDLANVLDNINNYPGIRGWIGDRAVWREILGSIVGPALGGGKRRLGRFLFARKITEFRTKIQALVQGLQANGDPSVTFHVIAGLAGGTGSGSVVDVVAQLRLTYPDADRYIIVPYLLLPEQYPQANWDTGNYHANGFAALTEINALSTGSYRPVDVSTGRQIDVMDPFNNAYIITNENENGYIARVDDEVPSIVAEFLFQKIFVAAAVGADAVRRLVEFENLFPLPETGANARTGQRSKRFLSFGIKRISIPEEEIKEYLTLSFAQQGIQQLNFNNWQQTLGFLAEPRNFDPNAVVRSADVLANWRLSDSYLLLAESILGSDDQRRLWKSLAEEWASVTPAYKQLAQQQEPRSWITALRSFFENRFNESYRSLGVTELYRIKGQSRTDMAKEIRRLIERELLEQWRNGSRSLQEISRIIDALSVWLQEKIEQTDTLASRAVGQLDELNSQEQSNRNDWASLGVIGKALGRRDNIFERQSVLLQSLYTEKTRIEAYAFARLLLFEVISETRDLRVTVDSLTANIRNATTTISQSLEERLVYAGDRDTTGPNIRFCDNDGVRAAIKALALNEATQSAHASRIRSLLLATLGENLSFARLREQFSVVDLIDSITAASEESALAAHANMINEANRQILGVSILSKLQERYGANIEALNNEVRRWVDSAGTFLKISPLQRDMVAPGIPQGDLILVGQTVVMLPRSANQEGFIREVRQAFRNNVPNLVPIDVDKQTEITILTMKNSFPLRMVGILPFLKDKFDQRVNTNRERMELEIFTSGTLQDYPSLFAQGGADLRREAGVQILLGLGLGLVSRGRVKGMLVFNSKDDDGFDNPPIELGTSVLNAMQRLDSGSVESITSANQQALQAVTDPAQAESIIKATVEESREETGNDPANSEYQQLVECAKISLKTIREATA